MTEASLKTVLKRTILDQLRGSVVLSHTGAIHAGIPDLSVTWNKCTSWWEVKLAKPNMVSRGVQELMLKHLATAGIAHYVIYQVISGKRRTGIVNPLHPESSVWTEKFNHAFVVDFIRRSHSPLDTSFNP